MSPRKPLPQNKRKGYEGNKISDFSKNMQNRRLELGMRQEDIARILGIPRTRISELEGGRFPEDPERVWRIADALKITCDELLRPKHE